MNAIKLEHADPENPGLVTSVAFTGWQPIETAPKDRTPILLFSPTFGVFKGEWFDLDEPGEWTLADDYSDGWGLPDVTNATHWMPLPEPPNVTQ